MSPSPELLLGIIGAVVEAIVTIDDRQEIVLFNGAAERMFDCPASEARGQHLSRFIPPRFLADLLDAAEKSTAGHGAITLQMPLIGLRAAGIEFPVEADVAQTSVDDQPSLTLFIRHPSPQRDRDRMLQLMDLANLLVRGEGDRIARWNRGAERLYGYTAAQAIGQNSHQLLKTRFPEDLAKISQRLQSEGIWEGELTHTARDGREIIVASEWTLFPGTNGEAVAVVEANIDITAQKMIEKALRESEDRFRSLFSSMSEGFCLCQILYGADGKPDDFLFLAVNPAYARILGRSEEQIVGKRVRELLPSVEPYWIETLCEPAVTGETVRYTNYAKAVDRWFDVYAFSPEPGKFAALSMDVTDRQRAKEAQSRQAEELARSNVELERFAYVASHDLQEPMRTVQRFTRLLERRVAGTLSGDAEEYFAFITSGVERMQTLINDLLAYSRVSSHGEAFGPADCQEIVRRVLDNLAASIEASHAHVTVDPLPVVVGDATQLGQVFQNLVVNAIKFRGKSPPRIHVSVEITAGEWIFSVKDNGIGISPEFFERIFIIFQRLHTIEEYGGTGIGLAICKKIAERHGGRIWVESEPGKGSVFHFTILNREKRA